MGYYDYERLRAAAAAPGASQADVDALGSWFADYGTDYWNGEYYDAEGLRVYPVYAETEPGEFELKKYDIR